MKKAWLETLKKIGKARVQHSGFSFFCGERKENSKSASFGLGEIMPDTSPCQSSGKIGLKAYLPHL
jgi:hypothetical protein